MNKYVNITMAQIDSNVGDIEYNKNKIKKIIAENCKDSDIIVFPELSLCGYPPKDLCYNIDFIKEQEEAFFDIFNDISDDDCVYIIGMITMENNKIFNSARVFQKDVGRGIKSYYNVYKSSLPNYGIFDEKRYFAPGKVQSNFTLFLDSRESSNVKFSVMICEDLWDVKNFNSSVLSSDFIVCISASPFSLNKEDVRFNLLKTRVMDYNIPIVYCNLVGAQEEVIFDGNSMVVNREGNIIKADSFREEILNITLDLDNVDLPSKINELNDNIVVDNNAFYNNKRTQPQKKPSLFHSGKPVYSDEKKIFDSLSFGLKSYLNKQNFNSVVIGESGGLDSAIVTCIALNVLDKENILPIYMPSRFSSLLSENLVKELCENNNLHYLTIPIDIGDNNIVNNFVKTITENSLDKILEKEGVPVYIENLQARIRGTILMYHSNKNNSLVLSTGNKSELSVGYATLYGDMCGGISVIGDVYKTKLFDLAEYIINETDINFPKGILERPPSAELSFDQKDSDSLPPYDVLDNILSLYIDNDKTRKTIINMGFEEEIVNKVVSLVNKAEYKRKQYCPILRITDKVFGYDRRMPIVNKFF